MSVLGPAVVVRVPSAASSHVPRTTLHPSEATHEPSSTIVRNGSVGSASAGFTSQVPAMFAEVPVEPVGLGLDPGEVPVAQAANSASAPRPSRQLPITDARRPDRILAGAGM